MKKYIPYYRVSTERQGQSGLGLDGQKRSVERFIRANGSMLRSFTDIESGGNDDRKNLSEAILLAEKEGATIVVKDLDRLTRGGFKVTEMLQDMGIDYIEADSPNDSEVVKDLKISIAKDERRKISARTQTALSEIKAKIERDGSYITSTGNVIRSLGNPQYLRTNGALEKSIASRKEKAKNNVNNIRARAMSLLLRENKYSYSKIAEELNRLQFKTSRGKEFSAMQVQRLCK